MSDIDVLPASALELQAGPAGTGGGEVELRTIACERIQVLPGHNARAEIGDLSELCASIRALGVLQALTVVELGQEDGQPTYGLIAGERRLRAAGQAGLQEVPCLVRRGLDERQRVAAMLVENLQREDLAALEEAEGLHRLSQLGMSQREIAGQLGCSQSHVSKRLALLGLPGEIRAAVDRPRDAGGITVAEALELTRLADTPKWQLEAFQEGRRGHYGGIAGVVRSRLQELGRAKARAEARARLQSAGVAILKEQDYYSWYSRTEKPLRGCGADGEAIGLTLEQHQGEPCHAAAIDREGHVIYVCREPQRHADVDPRLAARAAETSREQERQRAESRLRREAALRRREAAQRVLAGANTSQLPFAARQVLESWRVNESRIACDLLGLQAPRTREYATPDYCETLGAFAAGSMAAAIKALLALALATGEERVGSPWGGRSAITKRHLELLAAAGYEPNGSDRQHLSGEPDGDLERDLPECRVCGCTDEEACCQWVTDPQSEGDLCSRCLPGVLAQGEAGEQ